MGFAASPAACPCVSYPLVPVPRIQNLHPWKRLERDTGRPRKRGKFVSRWSYLTTRSSLLDANWLDSCLRYFSPQVRASTSACTSALFWRAVHGLSVPLLVLASRCADVHPLAFLRPETFRALQRRLRTLGHTAAQRRRLLARLGPARPPFDGLVMC